MCLTCFSHVLLCSAKLWLLTSFAGRPYVVLNTLDLALRGDVAMSFYLSISVSLFCLHTKWGLTRIYCVLARTLIVWAMLAVQMRLLDQGHTKLWHDFSFWTARMVDSWWHCFAQLGETQPKLLLDQLHSRFCLLEKSEGLQLWWRLGMKTVLAYVKRGINFYSCLILSSPKARCSFAALSHE